MSKTNKVSNVATLEVQEVRAVDLAHAAKIRENAELLGKSIKILFVEGGKYCVLCWNALTKTAKLIWNGIEFIWNKVCEFLVWLKQVITGAVNGAKAAA